MNRPEWDKDILKAIQEAPKIQVGEELHAFPDAARGLDIKVIIEELRPEE